MQLIFQITFQCSSLQIIGFLKCNPFPASEVMLKSYKALLNDTSLNSGKSTIQWFMAMVVPVVHVVSHAYNS